MKHHPLTGTFHIEPRVFHKLHGLRRYRSKAASRRRVRRVSEPSSAPVADGPAGRPPRLVFGGQAAAPDSSAAHRSPLRTPKSAPTSAPVANADASPRCGDTPAMADLSPVEATALPQGRHAAVNESGGFQRRRASSGSDHGAAVPLVATVGRGAYPPNRRRQPPAAESPRTWQGRLERGPARVRDVFTPEDGEDTGGRASESPTAMGGVWTSDAAARPRPLGAGRTHGSDTGRDATRGAGELEVSPARLRRSSTSAKQTPSIAERSRTEPRGTPTELTVTTIGGGPQLSSQWPSLRNMKASAHAGDSGDDDDATPVLGRGVSASGALSPLPSDTRAWLAHERLHRAHSLRMRAAAAGVAGSVLVTPNTGAPAAAAATAASSSSRATESAPSGSGSAGSGGGPRGGGPRGGGRAQQRASRDRRAASADASSPRRGVFVWGSGPAEEASSTAHAAPSRDQGAVPVLEPVVREAPNPPPGDDSASGAATDDCGGGDGGSVSGRSEVKSSDAEPSDVGTESEARGNDANGTAVGHASASSLPSARSEPRGPPHQLRTVLRPWFINRSARVETTYDLETTAMGQGAFASVCRGVHRATGLHVAVKAVEKRYLSAEQDVEALRREVEIHLLMQHRHVTRLLEVYETRSRLHLVMERATHGTLTELQKRVRRFTEREAQWLLFQLAHAVAYVHSKGVLHADVKPDNCLLSQMDAPTAEAAGIALNRGDADASTPSSDASRSARVARPDPMRFVLQLCDFGLARKVPNVKYYRATGSIYLVPFSRLSGTPGYIAPGAMVPRPRTVLAPCRDPAAVPPRRAA